MIAPPISNHNQRQILPDLIRIWALIGIVCVNAFTFGWPTNNTPADSLTDGFINILFLSKSYTLFSLMFGASFAYQITAADRAGQPAVWRHYRRMAGLFLFGLLHITFLYEGDILIMYALLGCFLYGFRHAQPSFLLSLGIICILAQFLVHLIYVEESYTLESNQDRLQDYLDRLDKRYDTQERLYTHGTFWQVARYRASLIPTEFTSLFVRGLDVFGYFTIGLAMARQGLLNSPGHTFWWHCRRHALPVGLAGSLLATIFYFRSSYTYSSVGWFSTALYTLFAPVTALGIAGWIALCAQTLPSQLKHFLQQAGANSLSIYILQSVILSLIFYGYGAGQFNQMGTLSVTLIALFTGVLTIIIIGLWHNHFNRGPLEYLLRRWTYLRKT